MANFSESAVFSTLHDPPESMMTWMGTLAMVMIVVLDCESSAQTCVEASVSENESDDWSWSSLSNELSVYHVAGVSSFSSGTWSRNALHDCICGTACLLYIDTDQICDLEVHNDHIWHDSSGLVVCGRMRNCHHGCLICGHSVSCDVKRKLNRHRLSAQPVALSLLWLVQVSRDGLVLDLFQPKALCEVSLICIC